jgi:ubiquinone/menaquinone biosynthesis C-methylase UbiE
MKYEDETKNRYRSEIEAVLYNDGYTNGYSLRILKNKLIAYYEQKAIMKATTFCSDIDKLIDIPCGTGKMTELLSKKYRLYIGVDMSYEMMQQINSYEKLAFIQADGSSMPFIADAVDLIVSLRLIHRLPAEKKHQFFTELSRVSSKSIIFSFSDDSLLHRVLLRVKMTLGMVPEKVVMEPFEPYHELLMKHGFIFKNKISVLPLISNQVVYLYAVK